MSNLKTPITAKRDMIEVLKTFADGTQVKSMCSRAFAEELLKSVSFVIDADKEFDIIPETGMFSFKTDDFVLVPTKTEVEATGDEN